MTYVPNVGDTVMLVNPAKIEGAIRREAYLQFLASNPELTPGQPLRVVKVTHESTGVGAELTIRAINSDIVHRLYRWEIEPYLNLPRFDEAGAL